MGYGILCRSVSKSHPLITCYFILVCCNICTYLIQSKVRLACLLIDSSAILCLIVDIVCCMYCVCSTLNIDIALNHKWQCNVAARFVLFHVCSLPHTRHPILKRESVSHHPQISGPFILYCTEISEKHFFLLRIGSQQAFGVSSLQNRNSQHVN